MNRIITVSRQFGSAGHTIGQKAAQLLGIPCYDQQIIEKIAADSGLSKDYITEKGEYATRERLFSGAYAGLIGAIPSNQDSIWALQSRLITELAEKGPCVIVGRCADYILRDKQELLRVFVYADMETRKARVLSAYGDNGVPVEKRVRDKDKNRASYYGFYTDLKWGRTENYDLCLNSGAIGIDACARIIAEAYKKEDIAK